MKLKVIKTYESNKIALCVGMVEHAVAVVETLPAYLFIKSPVQVGQLIDMTDAPVERVGIDRVDDETGETTTFFHWKLKA